MFRNFIICILNVLLRLFFRIETVNTESLPEKGGFVLAPNHFSNWDPVMTACFTTHRKIFFLAKAELFKFKPFGALISSFGAMPLSRDRTDAGVIMDSVRLLKNGGVLCIYPEGTRVRKGKKARAKKGAVKIAYLARVPIYPVHIDTNYRIFSKIRITVGEPIEIKETLDENAFGEKTAELMNRIYSL